MRPRAPQPNPQSSLTNSISHPKRHINNNGGWSCHTCRVSSRWVVLVESTSPSHPRRVIASLSRRRRVNRVSASHPRVVMVPHRVILAESSSPRRVLEWKSSRPRRVLKYRLKIRVSIYLFLSVGRKMTPFPETVSDPSFFSFSRGKGRRSSPLLFKKNNETKLFDRRILPFYVSSLVYSHVLRGNKGWAFEEGYF